MTSKPVLPPLSARAFGLGLGLCLAARVALLPAPGYVFDVELYERWAILLARAGIAAAYDGTLVDYPPFFLYLLWAAGKLFMAIDPAAGASAVPQSWILTALVKTPHLIFDLLLGGLLYRLVARHGFWGAGAASAAYGRTAALLYLANPAVIWDSGYWGQPDGVHSALALAALAVLAGGRLATSGGLLAAASLMKPLAAPLVPLLAWAAYLQRRTPGLALAATGGLVATLVLFLPFLLTGRILAVLGRVLTDLDAMPYASVNATNLWWLLGASRNADAAWLGPLSPRALGLALFLGAYAALLIRSARWLAGPRDDAGRYGSALCLTGAAIASGFFLVTTHMHENHLFMAIPLLLATAGRSRRLLLLAAGCSLAVLANGLLHDLWLPGTLPGLLAAASPWIDPHLDRHYTWLQVSGSTLNALLVVAVTAGIWREAWNLSPSREE